MFVYLASTSNTKVRALRDAGAYWGITRGTLEDTSSGIPEQPIGRAQIKRGAIHRIDGNPKHWDKIFRLGIESGVLLDSVSPNGRAPANPIVLEVSCVVFRTNLGTFTAWSTPFTVNTKITDPWLRADCPSARTMASMAKDEGLLYDDKDWYRGNGCDHSRTLVLTDLVSSVFRQYFAQKNRMQRMPTSVAFFKGVHFMDIGHAMYHHGPAMLDNLDILFERLSFTHVIGVQSRGFLGLLELAKRFPGVRVLMARTKGKLPGGPQSFAVTEPYEPEYGGARDPMVCQLKFLPPGSRVVVYDDVGVTMETLGSLVDAVRKIAGVEIVACVTLYAVTDEDADRYIGLPRVPETRYLFHKSEATAVDADTETQREIAQTSQPWPEIPDQFFMAGPKFASYLKGKGHDVLPTMCDRFAYSKRHWFPYLVLKGVHDMHEVCYEGRTQEYTDEDAKRVLKDKRVTLVVDTTDTDDVLTMLQMLSILPFYGAECRVVFPFFEHATQERIEERDEANIRFRSLAQGITMLKLFSPYVEASQMYVFDIHVGGTATAASNRCHNETLMPRLLRQFFVDHPHARPTFPDDGAWKRYHPLIERLSVRTPSLVLGKRRVGDERVISSLDEVVMDADIDSGRVLQFVFVDDMVRTGKTLKASVQYIRERAGARRCVFYAVVPHVPLSATTALEDFYEVHCSDTVLGPFGLPDKKMIRTVSWVDAMPEW